MGGGKADDLTHIDTCDNRRDSHTSTHHIAVHKRIRLWLCFNCIDPGGSDSVLYLQPVNVNIQTITRERRQFALVMSALLSTDVPDYLVITIFTNKLMEVLFCFHLRMY